MDLREKIQKLLEVSELPREERKVFEFILTTMPEGPLETALYPQPIFHVEGRFEWFFKPNGERRQKAA